MDAHQFIGSGVTGANSAKLSYSSSYPTVPSIPTRLFEALKFDSRNSPNSPFSSHFDSETLVTLNDSQEQHSSPENLSRVSSCCNSLLETNSSFQRQSPSLDFHQDLFCSGGTSILQNANYGQNMKNALHEFDTPVMEPDDDVGVTMPSHFLRKNKHIQTSGQWSRAWSHEPQGLDVIQSQPSYGGRYGNSGNELHIEKRGREEEESSLPGIPSGSLKQLLVACAKSLCENQLDDFENLIEEARAAVSISGEPIQRLGAYMVEVLVARKEASGGSISWALRCREPEGKDLLSHMHILYEICPYLKFGYMAANGAIAEACRGENRIHIVDFQIGQGNQWLTLLQALAARPGGAPHVRITGIDDPVANYARGDSLEAVGRRLATISEFNIPFEFHAVQVFASDVTKDMLDVRPGEALIVNFPLQLHHTPDESVDMTNPRDGLLRMVKSLSPKVVTLVEQESNTNTAPFFPRFLETLDYYLAMFESIDWTLGRNRKERVTVEQHCLARDIVNIIACEGKERVERHELFGKWKSRLTMAGFKQYPLNSYVNSVIRGLLRCYSDHYTMVERDGAMLLGWKDRYLISASAWH